MKEPLIHSHITDKLPVDHPKAFETLFCKGCSAMIHAVNNECMRTWVESGQGNYCLKCFAALPDADWIDIEYGLED